MSKSNATAMRGLRVLYILPLVCGALALNARTVTNCKVTENSSVSDDSTVKVEIQKTAVEPSIIMRMARVSHTKTFRKPSIP